MSRSKQPDTGVTRVISADGQATDRRYAAGADKARRKDKAWFAQRPNRRFRLRKPTKDELAFWRAEPAVEGYPAMMLVQQVAPGVRHRRLVHTHLDSETPEPIIEAFARLVERGDAQDYRGEISNEDLRAELGMEPTETRH